MKFCGQSVRNAVFAVIRRTTGAPPISWFRGLTSNTYAYWKFVGFAAVPGYAAGAAGHGPQLAPLAGQQHDDPAGFAQLMAPEHQGLGGEESHGERAWSNGKPG